MEQLFFELIRVAIGTQDTLSRPPSRGEWAELYAMAKKQSLVGVCFAGLQKLYNSVNQEPSTQNPQPNSTQNPTLELCSLRSAGAEEPITHNLDEVQYLQWMGMAAKIQQKSEEHRRVLKVVAEFLQEKGHRAIFMKGLTCAERYPEPLLRQCGDIDFVVKEEDLVNVTPYSSLSDLLF